MKITLEKVVVHVRKGQLLCIVPPNFSATWIPSKLELVRKFLYYRLNSMSDTDIQGGGGSEFGKVIKIPKKQNSIYF